MKINYRIMINLKAKLKFENFFITTHNVFDAKQLTSSFSGEISFIEVLAKVLISFLNFCFVNCG